MASVRKGGNRHYIRYTDADGVRHESESYTDKRVAERRCWEIEHEAEQIKAGPIDPKELAIRQHSAHPIADRLEDFRKHLEAKGDTTKHAKTIILAGSIVLSGGPVEAIGGRVDTFTFRRPGMRQSPA